MSILRTVILGAGAGAVGGIVQPTVGKLEGKLFFPPNQDTNIPRHFVEAMEDRTDMHPPEEITEAAALTFHVGYALFWGAAYATAREKWGLQPIPGGIGLGALLYALAFSRMGAGVEAGNASPPDGRSPREWLLHTTMPLVYGLTTSHVYEKLRDE